MKSVKAKFGSNWYKKVEDTEYDCDEAYELRMEDEWREIKNVGEKNKKKSIEEETISLTPMLKNFLMNSHLKTPRNLYHVLLMVIWKSHHTKYINAAIILTMWNYC